MKNKLFVSGAIVLGLGISVPVVKAATDSTVSAPSASDPVLLVSQSKVKSASASTSSAKTSTKRVTENKVAAKVKKEATSKAERKAQKKAAWASKKAAIKAKKASIKAKKASIKAASQSSQAASSSQAVVQTPSKNFDKKIFKKHQRARKLQRKWFQKKQRLGILKRDYASISAEQRKLIKFTFQINNKHVRTGVADYVIGLDIKVTNNSSKAVTFMNTRFSIAATGEMTPKRYTVPANSTKIFRNAVEVYGSSLAINPEDIDHGESSKAYKIDYVSYSGQRFISVASINSLFKKSQRSLYSQRPEFKKVKGHLKVKDVLKKF